MDEEIIIDDLEEDLDEIELENTESDDIELEDEKIINLGTKNYKELDNKPKIQGNILEEDKSFEELGLLEMSNDELSQIFDIYFND